MKLFDRDSFETELSKNQKAEKIAQEAALLTIFNNKNIIKFFNSFRYEDCLCIVTEFCEVCFTETF